MEKSKWKNLTVFLVFFALIGNNEIVCQEDCECVPYYECDDGRVLSSNKAKMCTGVDVCCIPAGVATEPPPTPPPVTLEPEITRSPQTTATPVGGDDGNVDENDFKAPDVVKGSGCGLKRLPGRSKGNLDSDALRITGVSGVPEPTFYGEAPWTIMILKQDLDLQEWVFQCAGSLITTNFVLTAAHCVKNLYSNSPLRVRAGEWNVNSTREQIPPQNRDVSQVIIHPEYNSRNLMNDVALIRVDRPFELSTTVDTVCTPDESRSVDSKNCLAVGWGKDDFYKKGRYQKTLRKVLLPLITREACRDKLRLTKLGKFFQLLPGFLCAGGEPEMDTCEGDGGGPLYCPLKSDHNRYTQVGIISWGIDCGKGNPAVFADVAHYMPWIKSKVFRR